MITLNTGRALCLLLAASPAFAVEPLPTIEFGAGAAALVTPSYRGSDHYDTVAFPFPYFVYRGERVKVTRQGVRADVFGEGNFNLGLSGALTLPARSGDPTRNGMPDVDPTLEIGPSLEWTRASENSVICICVPVRAAVATDLRHWQSVGWVAQPHIRYQHFSAFGEWGVVASASAGLVFADRKYHAYFYDVAPQYATPDRPVYSADGGYSGSRFSVGLATRRGRWGGGIGVTSDLLEGAAFADSPLVRTKTSLTVGLGLSYRLWAKGRAGDWTDERP